MATQFLIKAIEKYKVNELFQCTDKQLLTKHAQWIIADSSPGYPCRVSLVDAAVGERVLAVPFMYHNVNSPYRASGPIFIREHSETAQLQVNEIPGLLRHRLLSVRAYNSKNFMIDAAVLQGVELDSALNKMFSNNRVEYIHIHYAIPGCFSCSVHRTQD